jgi:hypothetical protein
VIEALGSISSATKTNRQTNKTWLIFNTEHRSCVKEVNYSQAPVAQAYNHSYSGGRDQEDYSSKPANSSQDPILKKPFTKQVWWSGPRCRP